MTEEDLEKSKWRNRVTIKIPVAQLKKLRKNKMAQVMMDKRWYELRPQTAPAVFTAGGQELTKAQLKSILRKMV